MSIPNFQLHVGVYGVLERQEEVLVVRKTRGPYKGKFDLPGGRPNHGEALIDVLKREFIEETGIQVHECSHIANLSYVIPYTNLENHPCELYHIALIYRIQQADFTNFDPAINAEDVHGAFWISRQELREENSSPILLGALQEYDA
jgi:ADP-ribose pyrophosphatase YjhB (NUDIX family)